MANLMIPEGYEKLAAIGIAYKGGYEASKAYGILNAVYHNGSTFVSLKDGPEGEPTGDGVNWQYMAKGFVEGLLSAVQAKDTSGIIGTAGKLVNAQSLLDAIADRVANKLINKNKIVNNLTSTDVSAVLAAPQGKTLKDEIGEVNRKLNGIPAECSIATRRVTLFGNLVVLTFTSADMTSLTLSQDAVPIGVRYVPMLSNVDGGTVYILISGNKISVIDTNGSVINGKLVTGSGSYSIVV